MKRLALLLLAACTHKAPPPDCEHACAHVLDLMRAHLEDSITRGADHSTPASADALRATFEQSRAREDAACLATCEDAHDAACLAAAATLDDAQACATARP